MAALFELICQLLSARELCYQGCNFKFLIPTPHTHPKKKSGGEGNLLLFGKQMDLKILFTSSFKLLQAVFVWADLQAVLF